MPHSGRRVVKDVAKEPLRGKSAGVTPPSSSSSHSSNKHPAGKNRPSSYTPSTAHSNQDGDHGMQRPGVELLIPQLSTFNFEEDPSINPSSMEFQQFRNQVYNINHQCQEQERKNYLHVQKEFEEADFNADNISRSSGDSSVFLPRINNKASSSSGKYKDVKSKVQSSISSNSSTMKSRIQRVGGV